MLSHPTPHTLSRPHHTFPHQVYDYVQRYSNTTVSFVVEHRAAYRLSFSADVGCALAVRVLAVQWYCCSVRKMCFSRWVCADVRFELYRVSSFPCSLAFNLFCTHCCKIDQDQPHVIPFPCPLLHLLLAGFCRTQVPAPLPAPRTPRQLPIQWRQYNPHRYNRTGCTYARPLLPAAAGRYGV